MKIILLFPLLFLVKFQKVYPVILTEEIELASCPNSPNCVSTQEKRNRKRMRPIKIRHNTKYAMMKMKLLLDDDDDFKRAKLIEEKENYLYYEFTTKVGKFIDDVEFLFDEKTKQIHFRSASRKGWSDMGKNRRRMKKIRKLYETTTVTWTPEF
ncbi:MAG: DUF1499 domain-containing protein [Bacteroidota bacterium]